MLHVSNSFMSDLKQMNILLVTPNAPWPPHTGSAQRSALLHQALCKIGNVKTICLQNPKHMGKEQRQNLEDNFGLVATARRWGDLAREPWQTISKLHQPTAARMGNFFGASKYRFAKDRLLINSLDLQNLLKGVDLIVGRYAISVSSLDLIGKNIPCIIDVDDLDSSALLSQIVATDSSPYTQWNAKRHLQNINKVETDILSKAHGLWIANPDDRLKSGLEQAHYLPNIPYYDTDHVNQSTNNLPSEPTIGVIASYKHLPNIESIDWFLEHVWPIVLSEVPNVKFKIYGSQLDASLASKWSRDVNVEIVGFVESVSTAYADISLSICAVQRGAGTNIKVLESAKFNRLCILTKSAARGLTEHKEMKDALVVCENSTQMSEKLCHFLKHPKETKIAAQKMHRAVELHYSKQAFTRKVHDLVYSVLAKN